MIFLAHRGLDFGVLNPASESSMDSFQACIDRGYGVELDLQMTKDGHLVIWHDADLSRWSSGFNKNIISKLTLEELTRQTKNRPFAQLNAVLDYFVAHPESPMLAVHWTASNQSKSFAEAIVTALSKYPKVWDRILIFDVLPEWGQWLRNHLLGIHIAPSVSHEHDIKRFAKLTQGSLFDLDQAIQFKWADWLWLDEWDLSGPDTNPKSLYNEETFQKARSARKQTAVISPELHPEHEEKGDSTKLELRWKILKELNPTALCTDYSSRAKGVMDGFHVQA